MRKSLICPAARVRQGDLILYATSLKVRDILCKNFYDIEHLDPENANEKGYQRLLNQSRAKRLASYVISGQESRDAFLPTSVFMATEKNIPFNETNNTIEIILNEICPFSIVDGQHRVEGLKMAAEKDDRVLDFEIPVNIAIGLSNIEQMCHFLIVNTTQKSVEEGVAQRIRARLHDLIRLENVPHLPKWIWNSVQKGEDSTALDYLDYLNNDNNSPWNGRIKMANDIRRSGNINQKSFAKAIKRYVLVANNPIPEVEKDIQHKIFSNYWRAIVNIIGEEESVLFKYNGVELFCRFSVPFFNKIVNMRDYNVETMQSLLEEVFDNAQGDAVGIGYFEFWKSGGKASGLNVGALTKIYSEMVRALHRY